MRDFSKNRMFRHASQWHFALLLGAWFVYGCFLIPPSAMAQNTAELTLFAKMEAIYNQQKDSGQWQAAGETARKMVAVSQQQRMMPMLQMAALDYTALVELNLGNYQEAIKLYRQVVEGCEKSPPSNPQFRNIMSNTQFNGLTGIARCYRETGAYQEAALAFEEAIKFARSVRQASWAAAALSDLGHLRLGEGDYEQALQEFQESLPVLYEQARKQGRSKHDMATYAGTLKGMAMAYTNLGRYNDAEPLAKSGLAWMEAALGRKHTFTAMSLKTLAVIYAYQNRYDEALQLNAEALRIFQELGLQDTPQCLGIMNNISRMYVNTGQVDEGIEMARMVVKKEKQIFGETHPAVIISMMNLANIFQDVQRNDEAALLLDEARKIRAMSLPENHPAALELALLYCCNEFVRGGNSQALLKEVSNLIDNYQTVPSRPGEMAATYSMRALLHDRQGERAKAIRDFEESLKYSEQQRTLAGGGERERAQLFERFALNYGFLIAWYVEEGDAGVAKAFKTMELMKARSFMDALHTANVDLLKDLPPQERARYEANEKRLRDALSQAQAVYDSLSDPTLEQQKQAARAVYVARDQLYDYIVQVQSANSTHRQLISDTNEPATLENVQRVLTDSELLLSYAAFGTRLFVFSVQKDSVQVTELKVNEQQAQRLGIKAGSLGEDELKQIFLGEEGLLSVLSRPKESSTLNTRLAALWEVLIPEQDRAMMLDDSLELVTVLPDGLLALLPFETLVVSLDEDKAEYLLDAGPPLCYAPSASVMLNLARRLAYQPSSNREPVLTLGDPDYGQTAAGGEGRAARVRAGLARLPFSGSEATWVSQHFRRQGTPSTSLMRGQATEAELRRMITGREIVHLACHGIAEDQYGNFFGCLALAPGRRGDANDDGFLYTPEIYNLELKGCELAILSACETNFGPQQTGEGVWALSRGFLVSGARRVVASNWVVNDEAGATLVSYFAHELAKKTDDNRRDYAESLQKAKQSLRKQQKWGHPFYWSGLLLVGPN